MIRQSGLLRSRRFSPLFVTQRLGALNDNVLKNAMVVLLTFRAASWTTPQPEILPRHLKAEELVAGTAVPVAGASPERVPQEVTALRGDSL